MKNTELAKLREKTTPELQAMVEELRDTMLKARIARSMEGKQAGMKYRVARRQIARLNTLVSQKSEGSSAASAAPMTPSGTAAPKPANDKSSKKA